MAGAQIRSTCFPGLAGRLSGFPRSVGCPRCTSRACRAQREESGNKLECRRLMGRDRPLRRLPGWERRESHAAVRRRSEQRRSFLCPIARCRSLRIAPRSRLLCRRSPTRSVSARSSAARRRAIRCERRRRRRIHRAMREQPKEGLPGWAMWTPSTRSRATRNGFRLACSGYWRAN
jgi:hypothetical protein